MKKVSELIADVKDRASVPSDDERMTDELILKLLNQSLDEYIYPNLLKISEEYNVVKSLINLATGSGTPAFPNQIIPLPRRAYGRVLREVKYYDGSNNLYNLPYVPLEDEDKFNASVSYSATPIAYYFIGDAIKLIGPDVDALSTGKIVLHYIIEPNTLENVNTLYAPIYSMDYVGNEIRFIVQSESLPEIQSYCLNGQTKLFDLYRKSSGAIIAADLELTREVGGSFDYYKSTQMNTDNILDIQNFQDGGFPVQTAYDKDLLLIPSGRTQFTTLPYELDNLLAQKVAGRVLEIIGDTEGLQINEARVREIFMQVTSALGNRSRGESRKVVNRRSVLRDLKRQYRRNW